MKKHIILLFLFSITSIILFAQPSADYYNVADNKSGAQLKTALFGIINSHTERTYGQLWTDFKSTDKKSDGKVWDMYSNCDFTFTTDQCGNYNSECDCYNREHSFPDSWYGGSSPMHTDLFHLVPTDGWVNNKRGNLPFGQVSSPDYTSGNGSKKGNSTFSGYSREVFEPIDEYKGDFARSYFYMVTCYENRVSSWNSDQLEKNTYPSLSSWSVAMLLQWHKNDPVSEKETNRNNAVFAIQHNRNPFIDYPELAEYIWGDSIGYAWHANSSSAVGDVEFANLKIFPNPASDFISIKTDNNLQNFDYEIFTVSGKIILNGKEDFDSQINISMLESGIYFIKIKSSEKVTVEKIIIK